jgi:hypothetical protein
MEKVGGLATSPLGPRGITFGRWRHWPGRPRLESCLEIYRPDSVRFEAPQQPNRALRLTACRYANHCS